MLTLFGKIYIAQAFVASLLIKFLVSGVLAKGIQAYGIITVFPCLPFGESHKFLSDAPALHCWEDSQAVYVNVAGILWRKPRNGDVLFIHEG